MSNNSTDTVPVAEGISLGTFTPGFVEVQYDISNGTLREHILRKLRRFGFARRTLSVYYGPYSEELFQEIESFIDGWLKRYGNRSGLVDVIVSRPGYATDEFQMWLDKYENAFRDQFEHVQKTFVRIDEILNNYTTMPDTAEALKIAKDNGWIYHDRKDDTWRPYTGDQVMTIIKDVQYQIEELRDALAHRVRYESAQASKEKLERFTELESRLMRDDHYLKALADRCAHRSSVEIRTAQLGARQTTIDQSQNKGFTEQ